MSHKEREFQTCRHTVRTREDEAEIRTSLSEAGEHRGLSGASTRSRERPGAQCPSGAPEGPAPLTPPPLTSGLRTWDGINCWSAVPRLRPCYGGHGKLTLTSTNYYENAQSPETTRREPAMDPSPICPTERAAVPWEDLFASCLWDRSFRGGGLNPRQPDGANVGPEVFLSC